MVVQSSTSGFIAKERLDSGAAALVGRLFGVSSLVFAAGAVARSAGKTEPSRT